MDAVPLVPMPGGTAPGADSEAMSGASPETAPVRTTCPYCGVGCGVLVERGPDGAHAVRGDPDHPANLGRLCSKGAALAETLDVADRLLAPRVDGEEVDWDAALGLVATRLRDTIAEHGPESAALYVSGQLLTEDYYVANKLVKGWLGTANIDTNSRLCMASSVAGHVRAFGTDTVPGAYEDLELADLVVLVGSNLAWCHPVLFQRLERERERRPGMRVVLVDPRRTATAELADLHLALAPDSDLALFGGLLAALDADGAIDPDFVRDHVDGLDAALASVAALGVDATAAATGLEPAALREFNALFAANERVVTVYSQGVNQGARATDTVNAIIDCHLATGRIGRPGAGPFSITGQPNAMGGREVGGLANLLAAHTALDDAGARARVQGFWGSPRIAETPGPKAVELFERVADGRIRWLWIMATNPVDSLPEADRVRAALGVCPFTVVSDVVAETDTAACADVLLPSAAWSEKDGTVTNSERRVSRQRSFRAPPGAARPDWWQLAEVARRLGCTDAGGADAFGWETPDEIFREHAALSAAAGSPDFDIGAAAELDGDAYDALAPFQWPWPSGTAPAERRFFADGAFHTPTGRARMWPIVPAPMPDRAPVAAPAPEAAADRTVTLNTGRIRDQWHTMTRTGRVARLGAHLAEPFAEIAPEDARALGIDHADVVELATATGSVLVRALLTKRQRPGSAFVPMHWSDVWAARARVDALVSATLDPVSGQPASKSEPAALRRWPAASHAYLVHERAPDGRRPAALGPEALRDSFAQDYWALSPTSAGWRLELASLAGPARLSRRIDALLDATRPDAARPLQSVVQKDLGRFGARRLLFDGTRLVAAAFSGPAPLELARGWLAGLVGTPVTGDATRYRLLAGRPPGDAIDPGATVCTCLGVGTRALEAAVVGGCRSIAEIAKATGAGTNCGSCRPEIHRLLADRTSPARVREASEDAA